MANRVLPQPAAPQTSVGRPAGRPPSVISSRPSIPVAALSSCGPGLASGAPAGARPAPPAAVAPEMPPPLAVAAIPLPLVLRLCEASLTRSFAETILGAAQP